MKILFVSLRGLGDSAILMKKIDEYKESFGKDNLSILTWSKNQFVFSNLDVECNLVYVPMVRKGAVFSVFVALFYVLLLRKEEYDICINMSGDFKENIVSALVKARKRIAPFWARMHIFNNIITRPINISLDDVYIPDALIGMYDCYSYVFETVFDAVSYSRAVDNRNNNIVRRSSRCVGLFPFAAQECREWPLEYWDRLGNLLCSKGYGVIYICSSDNEDKIKSFKALSLGATMYSDISLDVFHLKRYVDLSVCLDSFSSHLSSLLEIPMIVIFGANHPRLFCPDEAVPLSTSGGCNDYPCYNKTKCLGSTHQYACISSISVNDVFYEISKKIN